MKSFTTLLYAILIGASVVPAQSPDFQSLGYAVGAADYLHLPDNALCAGVGGAAVAWKQRLTWNAANPALMDGVEPYAISSSWELLTNERHHFTASVTGVVADLVGVGVSFNNYGIQGIEATDEYGNRQGTFSDDETALALTASGRLPYSLTVGATARYLNQQLEAGRASGIGFDVGALWEGIAQVTIAMSVQHLGSMLWWNTGAANQVLPTARLGACATLLDSTLKVACEFSKTVWWPVDGSIGAEYIVAKVIALRGGMQSSVLIAEQQVRWPDFSLGVGFNYAFFGFDYGVVIPASELGWRHVFTVQINVDKMMENVIE